LPNRQPAAGTVVAKCRIAGFPSNLSTQAIGAAAQDLSGHSIAGTHRAAVASCMNNSAVAGKLHVTMPTVGKWRERFRRLRLDGLFDEPRPGACPPTWRFTLVMDTYATHKVAKVKAWLMRHPRFHVPFTPTSASWLNLYLDHRNQDPKPFGLESHRRAHPRESQPLL